MPGAIEQHFGTTHEATIVLTPGGDGLAGRPRVTSRHVQRRGLLDTLREIFLPQGYPESVSDDYLEYQVSGNGGLTVVSSASSGADVPSPGHRHGHRTSAYRALGERTAHVC